MWALGRPTSLQSLIPPAPAASPAGAACRPANRLRAPGPVWAQLSVYAHQAAPGTRQQQRGGRGSVLPAPAGPAATGSGGAAAGRRHWGWCGGAGRGAAGAKRGEARKGDLSCRAAVVGRSSLQTTWGVQAFLKTTCVMAGVSVLDHRWGAPAAALLQPAGASSGGRGWSSRPAWAA